MNESPGKIKLTGAKLKRWETLLELAHADAADWLDSIYDFLESEVRRAYGRGYNDALKSAGSAAATYPKPRAQSRRQYGTRGSALSAGKLRPAQRRERA